MLTLREILNLLEEKKSFDVDPQNNVVLTKEQIAEAIVANFEDAKDCLLEGKFESAFEAINQDLTEEIKNCRTDYENVNEGVFRLQYILNPSLPFSYKDLLFKDSKSFGNAILDQKIEDANSIHEAITAKLISVFLQIKKLDMMYPKIYEGVQFAENYYQKDSELAMLVLGYSLSGKDEFEYKKFKCKSVIDLYNHLKKSGKIAKFAEELETNKKFFAWLYANRFGSQVEEWQEFISKFEEKEIKQLANTQKVEEVQEEKEEVVEEIVEIINDVVEVAEETEGDL